MGAGRGGVPGPRRPGPCVIRKIFTQCSYRRESFRRNGDGKTSFPLIPSRSWWRVGLGSSVSCRHRAQVQHGVVPAAEAAPVGPGKRNCLPLWLRAGRRPILSHRPRRRAPPPPGPGSSGAARPVPLRPAAPLGVRRGPRAQGGEPPRVPRARRRPPRLRRRRRLGAGDGRSGGNLLSPPRPLAPPPAAPPRPSPRPARPSPRAPRGPGPRAPPPRPSPAPARALRRRRGPRRLAAALFPRRRAAGVVGLGPACRPRVGRGGRR